MTRSLTGTEILEDLKMLADWIRVKYPGERFELVKELGFDFNDIYRNIEKRSS